MPIESRGSALSWAKGMPRWNSASAASCTLLELIARWREAKAVTGGVSSGPRRRSNSPASAASAAVQPSSRSTKRTSGPGTWARIAAMACGVPFTQGSSPKPGTPTRRGFATSSQRVEVAARLRAAIAATATTVGAVATRKRRSARTASGYVALTSSQNGGNGFTFPLAVLLPPLAVLALRRFRVATAPTVVAVAAIAALNLAATSTLWDDVAKPRLVGVPGFGELPWVNGTPHAIAAIRAQVPGPDVRFVERDEGWTEADAALAGLLLRLRGPDDTPPVTAFASRHRAISSNSVQLAALAEFQRGIPFAQLNAEPRDSIGIYVEQLDNPGFEPPVLSTMDRNTDDFEPLVTQAYAEAAALRLGFRKVSAMTLPDGRRMRIWVKQGSEAAVAFSRRSARSAAGAPS